VPRKMAGSASFVAPNQEADDGGSLGKQEFGGPPRCTAEIL